uniref:Uncharacterized protein n=2 Tax=Guillardia theta TaxID=55529 RepID=A0A7S4L6U9_GUITH|mmetsp:Transcript_38641/g.121778  ORF Transcript_38641/g.121778 Transcript_38641/m.121778 type:complete len:287 (+) Transcript_38641:1316-2176(+)
MSFLDAERGLNEEIRKVQQNRADLEDSMMEILRNLEKRQIELERAHQDLERLLAEQRNNTTSLRGDVQNLTQQQQETEAEIQRCRNEIQRIEAACKVCIQETGLCEQRRSHLSSEYDMLMRKERLRIEYMEQTQALNKQAMEEIEKALLEVEESKKTILKDKEKIQAEIDKCAGAIRKFLEADRDRKQQMNDFQNKRKIILDGMNSMLSNQEDLKKIIEEVRQPVSRVLSYYNRSYASVAPASAYKSFEISDKSFEKSSYSTSYYSSEGSFPKYRLFKLWDILNQY